MRSKPGYQNSVMAERNLVPRDRFSHAQKGRALGTRLGGTLYPRGLRFAFRWKRVPTFATAHTYCASQDGPRKSGFLTERFLRGKSRSAGLLESEQKIKGNHAFFRDNYAGCTEGRSRFKMGKSIKSIYSLLVFSNWVLP